MPYMLIGNDVHKQNADGTPGELVPGGAHETHDEALAHLRALETNVEDVKADDIKEYDPNQARDENGEWTGTGGGGGSGGSHEETSTERKQPKPQPKHTNALLSKYGKPNTSGGHTLHVPVVGTYTGGYQPKLSADEGRALLHLQDAGRLHVTSVNPQYAVYEVTSESQSSSKDENTTYYVGGAIKAMGEGRIGGYLVPFGFPKDRQGEYFTPDTDFALDFYGGARRPVYFHHGADGEIKTEEIGFIDVLKADDNGLWAEAQLNMDNPNARRKYADVQRGILGWSSGSAPHLIEVKDDGQIVKWPIIEGSLTPSPSGGRRTTVVALKFAEPALTEEPEPPVEPDGAKEAVEGEPEKSALTERTTEHLTYEEIKMNEKLIAALEKAEVEDSLAFAAVKAATAIKEGDNTALIAALEKAGIGPEQILIVLKELQPPMPEMPDEATMADEVKPEDELLPVKDEQPVTASQLRSLFSDALKSVPGTPLGAPRTNSGNGRATRITNMRTPYHDLDHRDMSFLAEFRMARGPKDRPLPPEFYREFAAKAVKAYNEDKIDFGGFEEGQREAQDFAVKADRLAVKANELNNSVNDTSWVPTLWSSDLWPRARMDNVIASQIDVFEMPSDPYDYPAESTDMTVYAVAEASATAHNEINSNVFTRSKIGTAKVTFNAAKMGLQTAFSAEMNEDSIIPFIPQKRAQAMKVMLNAVDNAILNADATTGTTNINYKGANTSAAATSKFLYGGGDGLRHVPLVDTTGAGTDHGGAAPTLTGIRALRYKSGGLLRAYAARRGDLVYIVDPETYGKMLNIDELLTFSVNGRTSTVNDGEVGIVDGSQVIQSDELALTDATGFAMADASGTLGQLLIIYKPNCKVGYRRRIASDVSYFPWNDEYVLTMTVRMAFKMFDARSVTLLYNINVS